jgi:hypothetical protein
LNEFGVAWLTECLHVSRGAAVDCHPDQHQDKVAEPGPTASASDATELLSEPSVMSSISDSGSLPCKRRLHSLSSATLSTTAS